MVMKVIKIIISSFIEIIKTTFQSLITFFDLADPPLVSERGYLILNDYNEKNIVFKAISNGESHILTKYGIIHIY